MEERVRKAKEMLLILLSESFGQQYGIADFVETDENAKEAMDELAVESDLYQRLIKEIDVVLGIEDANLQQDIQEAYDKYDGGERLTLDPDSGGTFMGTTAPQHKLEVKPKQ